MDDAISLGRPAWGPAQPTIDETVEIAFQTYGPELKAHLRVLVRDSDDADDLLQEAFLRFHLEVVAGRSPDNARAWLHRVAINLAMSRGRHLQVRSRAEPRLRDATVAAATDDLVVRRDEQRRLRAALAELAEADREVLLLAAAGYTGPELALRLGRSQVATRTMLCRARGRLRIRLMEEDGAAAC